MEKIDDMSAVSPEEDANFVCDTPDLTPMPTESKPGALSLKKE